MAGALTAAIAAAFSGGAAVVTDDYFEYTTLLLPGSGTNGAQNNTFLDGSTNNFTITRNGNTTQGTFSPFSQTGWGNYFDGTGDYLSVPDNAAFTLGNSDFCIELWINSSPSMAGYAGFFGQWANATTNCSYVFRTQTSQIVQFSYTTTGNGQTGTVVNGSALTTNSWNHLVVCRSGANLAIFQNGTRTATHNISTLTISDSTRDMQIGYSTDGGHVLGYMSNLRLVKGSSVYDPTQTTITVPTAPLTAITNTSLLTCQSNRFIDNSTNNFTITRNGDTRVVAFSPFNPTASWSAATYGGSGYFDGSGDSLTCSSILPATSDFTLSFWVYPTSLAGYVVGGAIRQADSGNIFQFFLGYTDGHPSIQIGGVYNDFTAGTIKANQWHYIQLVKASSAYTLYVNGTALSVTASNGNIGTTSIASGTFYVQYNTGCYFSDVRVVASALSNTVPTAPLTAITNTSLLLNFTNAGIYDATSKNDLETVGNAQIVAPTPTKWGGGSMAFDGTTDYLVEPTSVYFGYGTGDFTIECWVYFNSTGTATIFSNLSGTASTNPHIYINSTIRFYNGGGDRITSSTSPSTGVWYHLAVCRASGSTRMFLDGTQTGSTYADTNDYGQSAPLGVGTYWNGGAPVTASTLNGYLQDVRVSKYARYVTGTGANAGKMVFNGTNDLALPTAAFPTL
jgi:hypothetical protein